MDGQIVKQQPSLVLHTVFQVFECSGDVQFCCCLKLNIFILNNISGKFVELDRIVSGTLQGLDSLIASIGLEF